ncbi:MAG TPA: immunoglobulin-like domain-containing protein, partial [Candidatus Paceibacterota bacterium]|nr:immunoglobulin-like domain-containing protein [Candidatus Paceibacterota bacterium]
HSSGASDGTWYWQVRAKDAAGNYSDWSDIWSVTLDTSAPAAPTITSPADGTHTTTAGLTDVTWTDESDSGSTVSYIYQSAYDADFTNIAYTSPILSTTDQPTPGTPPGTYYIHVKSVDAAGNESDWSDPIMVVVLNNIESSDDHQAPVITLNGDATETLTVGDTYTEEGATATDNVDGTDPVIIGGDTVDTSTAGTYTVTYNATDEAGNAAEEVTRTVIVNEASTTTGGTGNTGGLHRQPGSSVVSFGSTGGSVLGASVFLFLTDMGVGSTLDPDVTELQKILIADGYLNISAPTGFFGPLTQAAVKLYQGAHGIPTTGFVGPLTRNALNQGTGQDESANASIQQQIDDLMKQVEDLQKQLDAASTSN